MGLMWGQVSHHFQQQAADTVSGSRRRREEEARTGPEWVRGNHIIFDPSSTVMLATGGAAALPQRSSSRLEAADKRNSQCVEQAFVKFVKWKQRFYRSPGQRPEGSQEISERKSISPEACRLTCQIRKRLEDGRRVAGVRAGRAACRGDRQPFYMAREWRAKGFKMAWREGDQDSTDPRKCLLPGRGPLLSDPQGGSEGGVLGVIPRIMSSRALTPASAP